MPVYDADCDQKLVFVPVYVKITAEMLAWAREKERKFKEGPHYNYDFEHEGGRLTGYVGERAFLEIYPEAEHVDKQSVDCVLRGQPYDIKTCKTNYKPTPYFGFNVTQKDLRERGGTANYFWCTVSQDLSRVYLAGWLSYADFTNRMVGWEKGQRKGTASNFVFTVDCWEVNAWELNPPMAPIAAIGPVDVPRCEPRKPEQPWLIEPKYPSPF